MVVESVEQRADDDAFTAASPFLTSRHPKVHSLTRRYSLRTEAGLAAREIGIVGHFGWHTFRHRYATLLKGNGEDVKVVQELMRHANMKKDMKKDDNMKHDDSMKQN